jgi:hypothetical protein
MQAVLVGIPKIHLSVSIKRMLHPVSCHSCIRRWGNNMVSQRLKKHGSDIVYLQKTKSCIRKHLITKADRSLVDCLCECADNILRGNVPLIKLQKEKLKRIKVGLRALTKSFVSILYHCRAFSSAERPCYYLSVWCKSDKKRDVTFFLWLDIRFLFLTGKNEGS